MKLLYIDLFCGAGGTSTGVEAARYRGENCCKVIACVNHDKNAIASHAANHPDALHFIEDIRTLDLTRLGEHTRAMREQHPDAFVVLWASLECTNFSKAKGGQSRDADSRTLADHLFRYINALNPDYIQIENVEEFMSWGDLDEGGKPISKDAGRLYNQWVEKVQYGYSRFIDWSEPDYWYRQNLKRGSLKRVYKYEHRILNSADYGAYTSRRRFFGIFARPELPFVWPEPTHAKNPQKTLFGRLKKKWKAVREVLDFSDEGESIFDRLRALVDATLERIYAGLIKFVAGGKDAFMVKWNSMSSRGVYHAPGIDDPCPVVSTQNRLGVAQVRFLAKHFSGRPEGKVVSIDRPAGSVTAVDHHSMVSADFISTYYGNGGNTSVDAPAPTVTTKDRFQFVRPCFIANQFSGGGQVSSIDAPSPAVMTVPKQRVVSCSFIDQQFGCSGPASVEQPLGAVTTKDKYSIVTAKPWVMNTNFGNVGSSIDDPAPVVTANRKWHYLLNPQYTSAGGSVDNPCFTLIARMDKMPPYLMTTETKAQKLPSFIKFVDGVYIYEIYPEDSPIMVKIKEFMALYGIMDIKMRMLRIPELKQIMGFPKDYTLIGTQTEQKKFIGNAVEVNTACALAEALVSKLYELNLTPHRRAA
jgi:DNA (cytosine-5)-methyltransferase 1